MLRRMSTAPRVAIVTGAGSGIGAAVAGRLARDGARVLVSDVNASAAETAADRLRSTGANALSDVTDVTDEDAVARLVDRAVAELGGLDVMVNNAGIGEKPIPIEAKPAALWNRVIATNLTGAFYGIKHAARVMKASGRGGVIVNMASILGSVGLKAAPAYTAAKHGLVGLTRAAALELAPFRIRVVAVSPAFIRTPLIAGMEETVLPLHPIGRLGEVEEVAALVSFLASADASFMTGASYLVDGGYTAQ